MKILVADDDPIISKLLCEVFTDDGHKVSAVTNGAQAVKQAQKIDQEKTKERSHIEDALQTKNAQDHPILCQFRFIISG